MSCAAILSALKRVAARRELTGWALYSRGPIGRLEALAHELAHALDLGSDFERRLDAMPVALANRHEASTLRIEVYALAAFGVRVDLRRLWRSANWRVSAPPWGDAVEPLTAHEVKCIAEFVDEVRGEIS